MPKISDQFRNFGEPSYMHANSGKKSIFCRVLEECGIIASKVDCLTYWKRLSAEWFSKAGEFYIDSVYRDSDPIPTSKPNITAIKAVLKICGTSLSEGLESRGNLNPTQAAARWVTSVVEAEGNDPASPIYTLSEPDKVEFALKLFSNCKFDRDAFRSPLTLMLFPPMRQGSWRRAHLFNENGRKRKRSLSDGPKVQNERLGTPLRDSEANGSRAPPGALSNGEQTGQSAALNNEGLQETGDVGPSSISQDAMASRSENASEFKVIPVPQAPASRYIGMAAFIKDETFSGQITVPHPSRQPPVNAQLIDTEKSPSYSVNSIVSGQPVTQQANAETRSVDRKESTTHDLEVLHDVSRVQQRIAAALQGKDATIHELEERIANLEIQLVAKCEECSAKDDQLLQNERQILTAVKDATPLHTKLAEKEKQIEGLRKQLEQAQAGLRKYQGFFTNVVAQADGIQSGEGLAKLWKI